MKQLPCCCRPLIVIDGATAMLLALGWVQEYAIHRSFNYNNVSPFVDLELHSIHSLEYIELVPIFIGITCTIFVATRIALWAGILIMGRKTGRPRRRKTDSPSLHD
jgi:hypothetical protein